jgi:hypothetical protein
VEIEAVFTLKDWRYHATLSGASHNDRAYQSAGQAI